MQGDIEWAIMTLGMTSLQKCSLLPFIIREYPQNGDSHGTLNSLDHIISSRDFQEKYLTPTNDQALSVIQGQNIIIGMRLSPPADWKDGYEKFVEPFEKFHDKIQFHFQLKGVDGVPLPREVSNLQLTLPAMMSSHDGLPNHSTSFKKGSLLQRNPSSNELFIYSETSFQVGNHHLDKPLVLLMTLSVLLHSDVSDLKNASMSVDNFDEEDNRKLLETYRFRPHKIPSRDAQLQMVLTEPLSVTTNCFELQSSSSCIWSILIENKHEHVSLAVNDIDIHFDISTRDAYTGGIDMDGNWDKDRESDDNTIDSDDPLDAEILSGIEANRWFDVTCHESLVSFPVAIPPGGSYTLSYTIKTKESIWNMKLSNLHQISGRFMTPLTIWWQLDGSVKSKYRYYDNLNSSASISNTDTPRTGHHDHDPPQISSHHRILWSVGLKTLQRLFEIQQLRLSEANYFSLENVQREYMFSDVIVSCKGPLYACINQPFEINIIISNRSTKQIRQLCVTRKEFFRSSYDIEYNSLSHEVERGNNTNTNTDENINALMDNEASNLPVGCCRIVPYAILSESGPLCIRAGESTNIFLSIVPLEVGTISFSDLMFKDIERGVQYYLTNDYMIPVI